MMMMMERMYPLWVKLFHFLKKKKKNSVSLSPRLQPIELKLNMRSMTIVTDPNVALGNLGRNPAAIRLWLSPTLLSTNHGWLTDYMFLFLFFIRILLIIENVYFSEYFFILYIKRETINHGFLVWLDYSTGGN